MAHYAQPKDAAISQRVIKEVADVRGVDPLDLPPLYEAIDPDALEQLFPDEIGDSGPGGRVVFTVAKCEVVVHSTGEVEVTTLDGNYPGSAAFGRSNERDGAESAE